MELFAKNIDVLRTIKYQLKRFLFGVNFADTYLFKFEKEVSDGFKNYFKIVDDIIEKRK